MQGQDSCCLATKTGAQYKYICGPKKQYEAFTLSASYGKDPLTTLIYDNEGYVFKCPDYADDAALKPQAGAVFN